MLPRWRRRPRVRSNPLQRWPMRRPRSIRVSACSARASTSTRRARSTKRLRVCRQALRSRRGSTCSCSRDWPISNLRFFDSAQEYFRQADALLVANSSIPGADVLARKRQNYAALDLLNRRDFSQAAGALNLLSTSVVDPSQPLLNAAIVRSLNQRPATSDQTMGVVAVPDEALLSQTVIDAQANWARSVALLGQNRPAESANALAIADASFKVLQNEPIRQQQLFWLGARIERQRARLLLRTGDRGGSLAALDKAIEYLKFAQAAGDSGPALAQTQLERAGVLARGGADRGTVLDQFDDALESLANADLSSNQLPPSTAIYLDELIKDAAANPSGISAERFFKALQIAADPAIARQFVELQSLVSADPKLASKAPPRARRSWARSPAPMPDRREAAQRGANLRQSAQEHRVGLARTSRIERRPSPRSVARFVPHGRHRRRSAPRAASPRWRCPLARSFQPFRAPAVPLERRRRVLSRAFAARRRSSAPRGPRRRAHRRAATSRSAAGREPRPRRQSRSRRDERTSQAHCIHDRHASSLGSESNRQVPLPASSYWPIRLATTAHRVAEIARAHVASVTPSTSR